MAIRTRLTEFFGLQHPIVLAPMSPAGWRLCRASFVHGESIGLVRDIPRAGELVRRISAEATARLSPGRQNQFVGEAGAAAERT